MLFGGLLMARFGWRTFFMVLGLGSLIWLAPWLKFMPKRHCAPITDSLGVPNLLEFLRLRSAWGTCAGLFCTNYVSYVLITWLPFYLMRERNFSMREMAQIGGAAYLFGACSAIASGWLSDRWIAAGATPTFVRKLFTGGGIALSGTMLALSVIAPRGYCIAAIILSIGWFGVSSSNVWAITQTLAGPKAAGRWTGFQNGVGNLAGVVAPALTGYVLQRTGEFYWAFVLVAAVAVLGMACWIFLVGHVVPVIWRGMADTRTATL